METCQVTASTCVESPVRRYAAKKSNLVFLAAMQLLTLNLVNVTDSDLTTILLLFKS